MKVLRLAGVLPLVLCASGVAAAQSGPVAVPLVGSPAAQQPVSPPTMPPDRPVQPPALTSPSAAQTAAGRQTASKSGRKLTMAFDRGTVALDAQNVTVRDVLTEWQRQSGCQFVNAEKLPASPVTLQFPAGTPQLAVLDSLLRGLGTANTGYGYIVGPRRVDGPPGAECGAVYILPTSRPTASPSYTPPASPIAPPVVSGTPDDEIPPVTFSPANPPPTRNMPPPTMPPPTMPPPTPNQGGQQNATPPASSGFGPVAPSAPGAGGGNTPPPAGGRGGGNQ